MNKILRFSVFENAVIFYNFMLYNVFTSLLAPIYFPPGSKTFTLLAGLGVLAASFIMRPIGAIVFGHIGDRISRKRSLTISILLLGVPTLVIGISPGYQVLGNFASIILIVCCLLQGFSIGGGYNGIAIFALESLGKRHSGFVSGIIVSSCIIGVIFATAAGAICSSSYMPSWTWRAPFIIGGLLSMVGLYIGRNLQECSEIVKALTLPRTSLKIPVIDAITYYKKSIILTAVMGALDGVFTYTLLGFTSIYLSNYVGLPLSVSMYLNLVGLITILIISPLAGDIFDYLGCEKYFTFILGFVILTIFPVFYLLQTGKLISIVTGEFLLGVSVAGIVGPQHALFQQLFLSHSRFSGIASSFCFGMALCGGTIPLLLTFMVDISDNLLMPTFLLATYALIGLFTIKIILPSINENQTTINSLNDLRVTA